MSYDRKNPNEVLTHAKNRTWKDGQRIGLKDGPFGLVSYRTLENGVILHFDTPDDQHGNVLLTPEMMDAFGHWLIREAAE